MVTWWLIPLSKWFITPVINGISRVNPLTNGLIISYNPLTKITTKYFNYSHLKKKNTIYIHYNIQQNQHFPWVFKRPLLHPRPRFEASAAIKTHEENHRQMDLPVADCSWLALFRHGGYLFEIAQVFIWKMVQFFEQGLQPKNWLKSGWLQSKYFRPTHKKPSFHGQFPQKARLSRHPKIPQIWGNLNGVLEKNSI